MSSRISACPIHRPLSWTAVVSIGTIGKVDVVQTYPLVKAWKAVSVSAHVFARAPTREGWEETHVLVVGGNGTHAGWATATNAVLSGRVEWLGTGTVVEDD